MEFSIGFLLISDGDPVAISSIDDGPCASDCSANEVCALNVDGGPQCVCKAGYSSNPCTGTDM